MPSAAPVMSARFPPKSTGEAANRNSLDAGCAGEDCTRPWLTFANVSRRCGNEERLELGAAEAAARDLGRRQLDLAIECSVGRVAPHCPASPQADPDAAVRVDAEA